MMWQKKNDLILDLVYDQAEENELYHHGILGMHWGVRRFQPYGQGYDPKNEGKEVGLAARMGGYTGSYSSMYGRGRSKSEMAKAALKSFGKKAYGATQELADRANYAADRASRKLSEAGKKARSGLARYAAKYDEDTARRTGYDSDPMLTKLYEMGSSKLLMKRVGEQFGKDAKRKVSDLKRTSWDDVRSAIGSGASKFESAMAQTKLNSKQFSTNAQATMALLRGAMDRSSSASQILEGRYANKGAKNAYGIVKDKKFVGLNDPRLRDLDEYRDWANRPVKPNYPLNGGSSKEGTRSRESATTSWSSRANPPIMDSYGAPTTWDRRSQGMMVGKELERAQQRMLKTLDAPVSGISGLAVDLSLRPNLGSRGGRTDPYIGDMTSEFRSRMKLDEIQKRSSSSTDLGKRLLGL